MTARARSTSDRVRSEARKATFSIRDCLQRAEDTFAFPPARPYIERPSPDGELVVQFVLPLEMCRTQNWSRHRKPGYLGAIKEQCFRYMRDQLPMQKIAWKAWPLRGRPQVLCTRFTSGSDRADPFNDGFKIPVDRLCCGKNGLGILVDDTSAAIDLRMWTEPASPSEGFGLVRVFSGRVSVI